jgi:hypothetical protein
MSEWIYRTLPPDEAYWCTSERLLQIVGGDKLIIPLLMELHMKPIQRPAFSA